MYTSRITQRGQTTIPSIIRNKLNLHTGDSVAFELNAAGEVVLHKAEPIDLLFLKSLNAPLSEEWGSKKDSEAYDEL
ncbi:MAG: AbrB/MazE/SpoVT family DNA-binding protein [Rickettsiaceae bacterium]|jgi:AbrB family looped-hinge helix DNA binding protein|nr:AbrB/MazE/SpoVT family DNA-binding protein [Rickettsiaceae bacterium]